MNKTRWVPKGSVENKDADAGAVWYTVDEPGRYLAVGYSGKRADHDFYWLFRTQAERDAHVEKWLKRLTAAAVEKWERRKARKVTENPFKEGDILYNSWGYEQTNVDFYQVVEVGAATVKVREIEQRQLNSSNGFYSYSVVGIKDAFKEGAPILTKRVQKYSGGYYLAMDHGSLSPWDGLPKHASDYH